MHPNPFAVSGSLDPATGPETIQAVNNRSPPTTYRNSHSQNFCEEDMYSFQTPTPNFPAMGGFLNPEAHQPNAPRPVEIEQRQGWGSARPLNAASRLLSAHRTDFNNSPLFAGTTMYNKPKQPGPRELTIGGAHGGAGKEPFDGTSSTQFNTIDRFPESRASQGPVAGNRTFSFLDGLDVDGIAPAMKTEIGRQNTTMAPDNVPFYVDEALGTFDRPTYDEPGDPG